MSGNTEEEESLKSQNLVTAETFEDGVEEETNTDRNELPEDELIPEEFDIDELLAQEKGERYTPQGSRRELDLGGGNVSDQVELYLVEELGYNPDSDYFNIAGSVSIFEDDQSVSVLYELEEDYTEFDEEAVRTPLIQFMDRDLLERAVQSQLNYSMVSVENEDSLKIGFRYDAENYDPASEEVGKAIDWIEENIPDYEDSGR
ncbi:MAG: hypothetical protein ACI9LV_000219 [Candidatus Nanohaloarchaea archaeon]|jgi:hypothetical protein